MRRMLVQCLNTDDGQRSEFQQALWHALRDLYLQKSRPHPLQMTKAEAFAGTAVAEFTMAVELDAVRRSEESGSLARAEYEAREREAEIERNRQRPRRRRSIRFRRVTVSQSQKALGVGLSGLIGLALVCDLPRSVIADELRRAAELSPSQRVRFAVLAGASGSAHRPYARRANADGGCIERGFIAQRGCR